jgi:hypothetical protein
MPTITCPGCGRQTAVADGQPSTATLCADCQRRSAAGPGPRKSGAVLRAATVVGLLVVILAAAAWITYVLDSRAREETPPTRQLASAGMGAPGGGGGGGGGGGAGGGGKASQTDARSSDEQVAAAYLADHYKQQGVTDIDVVRFGPHDLATRPKLVRVVFKVKGGDEQAVLVTVENGKATKMADAPPTKE